MPGLRIIAVLLIVCFSAVPIYAEQPDNPLVQGINGLKQNLFGKNELLPAEQAFQFFARVKDPNTLHLSWIAADGYYLYRDKIKLSLPNNPNIQLGDYQLPHGEPYHDEAFGQVEIFHGEVSIDVPLRRTDNAAQNLVLRAKYQGCADRGVCYPPIEQDISLALPAIAADTPLTPNTQPPLSEQDQIIRTLHQDTLWLTLLSFLGFGLLLAFTPCIFPMIPILSGIIVGHGGEISTRKAFLLSLSYVLASAAMYTVFGVLAALFGSNLQATFQHPGVIAAFSGVFVLLSLSMFDFYHLELPKSLQNWVHQSSDNYRSGSYWGAGIMGALSSLIVGPCVAAPLAAALIYIGQTGDVLLGGSALFMLGFGMGCPLLLLGASAGKWLPKAGIWLNSTKAVFGVIMLAVAVWMLDRILPARMILLLSAMLLVIPSVYMGALDPLPVHASGWRKLWKGLGFMMLVFGVLQLVGLSAGNTHLLQPLQGLGAGTIAKPPGLDFQAVKTVSELEQKLQQARAKQQPVMLDFYADWCVSCKEMESYTFADTRVQARLRGFVLLKADVTANDKADQALLKHFNLIGPPGIIFFDRDGQERQQNRVIGYQDAETFLKNLETR